MPREFAPRRVEFASMLKNYFLVAWRHLNRNRIYSLINILGLAIGITACSLILLYVDDELSFDQWHSKGDRIYRVLETIDASGAEGQGENSSSNPFPVGPVMQARFSEDIEEAVRFFNSQEPNYTLKIEEQIYNEKHLFFVDSNVFRVFDYPLLEGDPATALDAPNSIVLTEELAEKYFGTEPAMGKNIIWQDNVNMTVTGVMKTVPLQTHMPIKGLMSISTIKELAGPGLFTKNWIWNPCWTYVLLKENADVATLESKFPDFVADHYPDFIKGQITHTLQPLKDIHLESNLEYEIAKNGSRSDVIILTIIGIFILLIACINFMNLATARSANRAREVGMRKVFGAHRSQLIRQFLGESVLMSLLAVVAALCLIEIALPFFNNISGKEFTGGLIAHPTFLLGLILVGLLLGLLSGLYPAFYLSSFKPVLVLKGNAASGRRGQWFRKGLVVLQFAISTGLIISTLVIYEQFYFLRNENPGFKEKNIVFVPLKREAVAKLQTLKDRLLAHPNIESVSRSNYVLGEDHNVHEFNFEGMPQGEWIYYPALMVDEDFVKTFDIKILAGRDFSKEYRTDDSLAVLVNRTMVDKMGWGSPEKALGQQLFTPRGHERVVGVMDNFHFVSLEHPIKPFVLDITTGGAGAFFTKYLVARINSENQEETLAYIEKEWLSVAPRFPFEYFFLEDRLDQLYRSQNELGRLVGYFSILAVFIACLGLFALSSFTAEKRTREIGIRKVVGASNGIIARLMAMDFLKLVLISNVLALPITIYIMHNWLNGFAFHTDLNWMIFVVTIIGVLFIAIVTVLFQSLKASMTNPVEALRTE